MLDGLLTFPSLFCCAVVDIVGGGAKVFEHHPRRLAPLLWHPSDSDTSLIDSVQMCAQMEAVVRQIRSPSSNVVAEVGSPVLKVEFQTTHVDPGPSNGSSVAAQAFEVAFRGTSDVVMGDMLTRTMPNDALPFPWVGRDITDSDWPSIEVGVDAKVPRVVFKEILKIVSQSRHQPPFVDDVFLSFISTVSHSQGSKSARRTFDAACWCLHQAHVMWKVPLATKHALVLTSTRENVEKWSVKLADTAPCTNLCCVPHQDNHETRPFLFTDGSGVPCSRTVALPFVDPGTGWCLHDLYLAVRIALLVGIIARPGIRQDACISLVSPLLISPSAANDVIDELVRQKLVVATLMPSGVRTLHHTHGALGRARALWHFS